MASGTREIFGGIPFSLKILKQNPKTFYHISLSNGRKEKGIFLLICQEAEKVLKTADFYLVGMPPNEEVGKGKFRSHRREPTESFVEKRLFFKG